MIILQAAKRLAEFRIVLCGKYSSTFRKVRWRTPHDATESRAWTDATKRPIANHPFPPFSPFSSSVPSDLQSEGAEYEDFQSEKKLIPFLSADR